MKDIFANDLIFDKSRKSIFAQYEEFGYVSDVVENIYLGNNTYVQFVSYNGQFATYTYGSPILNDVVLTYGMGDNTPKYDSNTYNFLVGTSPKFSIGLNVNRYSNDVTSFTTHITYGINENENKYTNSFSSAPLDISLTLGTCNTYWMDFSVSTIPTYYAIENAKLVKKTANRTYSVNKIRKYFNTGYEIVLYADKTNTKDNVYRDYSNLKNNTYNTTISNPRSLMTNTNRFATAYISNISQLHDINIPSTHIGHILAYFTHSLTLGKSSLYGELENCHTPVEFRYVSSCNKLITLSQSKTTTINYDIYVSTGSKINNNILGF